MLESHSLEAKKLDEPFSQEKVKASKAVTPRASKAAGPVKIKSNILNT